MDSDNKNEGAVGAGWTARALVALAVIGAALFVILQRDDFRRNTYPASVVPSSMPEAEPGSPPPGYTPVVLEAEKPAEPTASAGSGASTQSPLLSAGNKQEKPDPGKGASGKDATQTAVKPASTMATTGATTKASQGGTKPGDASLRGAAAATQSQPKAKVDWAKQEIKAFLPQPNIVIYIKSRILLLRNEADQVRIYRDIAVGRTPGKKQARGDGKSPVGLYWVVVRTDESGQPALGINYPNGADADEAFADKRISKSESAEIHNCENSRTPPPDGTNLGGSIRITVASDRSGKTSGGFWLRAEEMKELYTAVNTGTAVQIVDQ